MTLRVAPVGWAFPEFEPGQYVGLGLCASAPRSLLAEPEKRAPQPEALIRRPYSIASAPQHRECLEFYINLVPAGVLTPRLFCVEPGGRIFLGAKLSGSFTLRPVPEEANVILIATGTGLAPYVSMLRSGAAFSSRRRIALIHGVRRPQHLGYRSLFTALQSERPEFIYLPVVSRPEPELSPWKGAVGHVQDVWNSGVLEDAWGFRPSPQDTHVLLCGNPEMIESMTGLSAREGFRPQTPLQPGQVHAEKYWPGSR